MDYAKLSDESLIVLIARAQPHALSELYHRYNRLVFSLALNTVGDPATAEEITLDVFARIWQRADTYQAEQAKVTTWLSRIARNRAIDVLRRRSVRPEQHSVAWAEVHPQQLPGGHNPEKITELNLRREQVRAAVAQLPLNQRQSLALAYFKGYTHQQIADELNQPLGTVKTRIRLAMNKLRNILQDD